MTSDLILRIARLTESLVEVHARQDELPVSTTEELLLEIARMAIRAHEQYTGEPLDPALIKAEASL